MFEQLKGKKLLYLGGTPRAKYVVERAQQLGVYVIVADYTEWNPAKGIADESVLINATDVDALEAYCRERKIDGVFSGYIDVIQPCWKELCERMGFACYIEDSMLKASTNKDFFKELYGKYGVPVPLTYNINKNNIEESASNLPYPVFVKPLDASGSRGADVCYNKGDFLKKYEHALSFSKKGLVTVEDFLQGTEFILDYMLVNGKAHLASMADRYCVDGRSAAINSPNLMVFPSKHLKRYRETVEPYVLDLFRSEGYKNGVVFLQGYAGEKINFYETGCRLGGTWPYIDEYFHGINPMDMLFNFSLNGSMTTPKIAESIKAEFSGNAAIIYFLSKKPSATISRIIGMEEVAGLPYVVHLMQYYNIGDHFSMDRFVDVRFSAVHLVADNINQLKERIKEIYKKVDYLDENGESLLAPVYNPDDIMGY